MGKQVLYIEMDNCIGCRSCLAACTQCGGHDNRNRNYVLDVDPFISRQTIPLMCFHCVNPACARSCPAQAIQIADNGAVLSALVEKCIGCQNCTIACPYGIPKFDEEQNLMYKCDLCYDRTKEGIPPMCASVCPTNTLQWIEEAELEEKRAQIPLANRKWTASHDPDVLEGETNVKISLPGILQGKQKLF
ncbi:4Fe-4S dicluster domain-containing protein [Brevibacillus formosus]|uniref:4Fe-4S ferredoxin n=1 Tax=Brevibacillus formosus TaxID=54913 RepID=A0A837KFU2_9BACL|nr:4Fe-4S dicluster domain-containing protein [Brevibacillus formosus]KLH96324.1 electron transfer flavoprotein [Brevibacillus formosus]MED1959138.1 4Fe-4S dicluster domain-containing protein [Brevibacillus formosus]PSJ91036.1 4Fe-4S dicluster domain-containing protein [Brevibacillus formosus]GED59888.1 4Fe-4S ferredoxin [Brevibacillus formosus]